VVHEALPSEGKVVVEGVNTAKRHRAARSATEAGGIIHIDKPIDASNVAVISPSDGKPTRVGYKVEGGKKVRICKRTGVELP
jgi:large subunit ribosomal protein L24